MDWEGIIGRATYDFAAIPTQGASVRSGADRPTRSDLFGISNFS